MPFVIAALAAWMIWPGIGSGWYGDDAWYSGLPAALQSGRTTLPLAIGHSFDVWLTQNGRFYPGQIVVKYVVFAVFSNLVSYKIFLIVATLAALEAARRLVAAIWNRDFANAAALCACVCFQERAYQDPFLVGTGMLQFVAIVTLLSLGALRRALLERSTAFFAASIAWYVVAAATYEITYVFGVLHVIVAARFRRPYAGLPFLAIGAAFGVASIALRHRARVAADSVYAFSADIPGYGRALGNQIAGALPLDYFIANPQHIFPALWPIAEAMRQLPVSIPLAIALFAAGYVLFARLAAAPSVTWSAVAFGFALLVLPAVSLPLVAKYQHELRPGFAYLPVVIEELGVGLLLASLAQSVIGRAPRLLAVLFAALLTLTGMVTNAANVIVVGAIDDQFLAPRVALERAVAAGLLKSVPAGTSLAFVPEMSWVCRDVACPDGIGTSDVLYGLTKKWLMVVAPADARDLLEYDAARHSWKLVELTKQ